MFGAVVDFGILLGGLPGCRRLREGNSGEADCDGEQADNHLVRQTNNYSRMFQTRFLRRRLDP